ncbi:hypothetical protein Krac_1792 [Ktedonobacter racemifer DSM 44963]|uniref:Uncharacterized protein n=1 Tax=Ktedonobacter racemifer DSM 44963 TaxID=485913 RepID=D6U3A3_KTERA|nr:hypothetical protein Krac_1792 [Ktedonobacter racemifer DSM 44963]
MSLEENQRSQTALLLVDPYNDFLSPEGKVLVNDAKNEHFLTRRVSSITISGRSSRSTSERL